MIKESTKIRATNYVVCIIGAIKKATKQKQNIYIKRLQLFNIKDNW